MKRIIQYRYYGENEYITKPVSQAEFNEIKENLYIYREDDDIFIKLTSESQYNSALTYYEKSDKNYPSFLSKASLKSGSAFGACYPISHLGIQSLPGVKFRINSNVDYNIIGITGVYELDLSDDSGKIYNLFFEEDSLDNIDKNESAYLIIDIVYQEE